MATDEIQEFKVFCLEGQWFENLEYKASLRGILDLLKSWDVIDDFIFRDVGTADEFRKYAGLWATEYQDYSLAYFASHGSGGHIWLDSDVCVSVAEVFSKIRVKVASFISEGAPR